MEPFLFAEITIFELLIVGTFVALAIRQLDFPFTVAIVLVGLAMALPQSMEVNFPSEVILALSIPPLLFGTARQIDLSELRGSLVRILIIALPGVILVTFIIAGTLTIFTPLALPVAFVFGAWISATDPFAIGALLRNSGAPKRLASLINSESLLSNATAIVVFNLAITMMFTKQFLLLNSLGEFIRVLVGGAAVGFILGWSISKLVQWGNNNLMEIVLTTLLPFGSYVLAERLHVSGALAVVTAALVNGMLRPQGTSSRPWEFLAFLANSLIFLLLSLQVSLPALIDASQAVLWAIVTVIVGRVLVMYGLNGLMQKITNPIPIHWLHVWNWSGMRGAIGMALVFSLPQEFTEFRELLNLMVFGVVLFSVLVQSSTLLSLLRWRGVEPLPPVL